MKTRKQKTPARKRAARAPVTRRAAKGRSPVTRKAKRAKIAPAVPAAPMSPPPAPESIPAVASVESQDMEGAEASLVLGAECTVAEADSLKAGLLRLLDDSRVVTLDISGLQRIDTAGLQLLAAFVRDRRAGGQRVEWRGQAPALETAAGLLGLRSMLELTGGDGR